LRLADAALSYGERGWRVFPCSRLKVPYVKAWPTTATTDPERIARWWAEFPSASIGMPTGHLIAIDVDGDKGGLATRRETEAQGLEWPVTLTALTGRKGGGCHLYYTAPEDVEIRNAVEIRGNRGIGPGIDVRGVGGFAVLPPSLHKSGRAYQWGVDVEPAPLPAWMVDRLRPPSRPLLPPSIRGDGERYASAALVAECERVESAHEGTLNETLNRAAFALGRFVASGTLDEESVSEALLVAAVRNGHPERGARNTIRSGLRAGIRRAG
jgi:hypothetical protein